MIYVRYSTISHAFQGQILDELDDKLREADSIYKEIESSSKSVMTSAHARRHEVLFKMYEEIQQEVNPSACFACVCWMEREIEGDEKNDATSD